MLPLYFGIKPFSLVSISWTVYLLFIIFTFNAIWFVKIDWLMFLLLMYQIQYTLLIEVQQCRHYTFLSFSRSSSCSSLVGFTTFLLLAYTCLFWVSITMYCLKISLKKRWITKLFIIGFFYTTFSSFLGSSSFFPSSMKF